jgi:hypothetical protein
MENLTHRAVGARAQRPAEPHAPQEAVPAPGSSLLADYVDDLVRMEMRVSDLQEENAGLRELLSVALEQLSAMTGAQRNQRDRVAHLLQELRELRRGASWRPAA